MNTILISLLVSVLCFFCFHRISYRARDEIFSLFFMRVFFTFIFLFLSTMLFSQICGAKHQIIGYTLFTPGSLLTRSITIPSTFFIRRILEPSALLFIFCLGVYAHCFRKPLAKNLLALSLSLAAMALLAEGVVISLAPSTDLYGLPLTTGSYLWATSLGGIAISFLIEIFSKTDFRLSYRKTILQTCLWLPFLILSTALVFGFFSKPSNKLKNVLAHYYVWFPENWNAGYAGQKDNHQFTKPFPSEYKTNDSLILAQQTEQMQEAGITHVIIDWWPRKPELKNRAIHVANHFETNSALQFAVHLETLDIAKDGSRDIIFLGEEEKVTLSAFFEHLVKRLSKYKNYYRINNKMVVYLYASRHLTGDVTGVFKHVREHIKNKLGEELYLVGDEIFYNVPDAKTGKLLRPMTPSWERLQAFDAITLYNPYDPHTTYEDSDEGIYKFLKETEELLYAYRGVSEAVGIPLIPVVIPGYDDRVLRPSNNASPLKRKTTDNKTLLEHLHTSIHKILGSSMPDSIIITSWNEWNEGTQIEPGSFEIENLEKEKGSNNPDLSSLEIIRSWFK